MPYLLLIKDYDDPYNIMDIVEFNSKRDMEQARELLATCDREEHKEYEDEIYNGFFKILQDEKIVYKRILDWTDYNY